MNRKIISTIIILSVIVLGLGTYIAYDKINEWKVKYKEEIYQDAVNDIAKNVMGTTSKSLDWDEFVVRTVNTRSSIPYILNDSIYFTPIEQLCE